MSQEIATAAALFPIRTYFVPGGYGHTPLGGNAGYATAIQIAQSFLASFPDVGSHLASAFAHQGFPNGNPSAGVPCRWVEVSIDFGASERALLAGLSGGAATALAVFDAAIALLANLTGYPTPAERPIVATGEVATSFAIRAVQDVPQKRDRVRAAYGGVQPPVVFAVPATQATALGMPDDIEIVPLTTLTDLFALAVRRWSEGWALDADLVEPAWHLAPVGWRPNPHTYPDASDQLIVAPGKRHLGLLSTKGLGAVLEAAWRNRGTPLPDPRAAPGRCLDELLLRSAAEAFARERASHVGGGVPRPYAVHADAPPDPGPVMPPPLVWDVPSLVRLDPSTSLSGPVVHVWVTRDGETVREVAVVGRGAGWVRREVEGLLAATCLQLEQGTDDAWFAGLTVVSAAGRTGTLDGLQAALAARFARPARVAADTRAALLDALVVELEGLAARTGLVHVHTGSARAVATFDTLWFAPLAPDARCAQAAATEEEGVALRYLGDGELPSVIPLPPALFAKPAFSELARQWALVVLDRTAALLDRRIEFYADLERDSRNRVAWWEGLTEPERALQPDVWVDTAVDLVHMTRERQAPERRPVREYYEEALKAMEREARTRRLRMTALREGARRARATWLPRAAAAHFVAAPGGGLAASDVVADCPDGLAEAYEAWRAEAGPVLRGAVRGFCEAHALSEASRAQVLTRHVVWRVFVGGDSLALLPHVLVHTRESRVVTDGRRGLRWAVHPLDAATNAPTPPAAERTARVAALVREAVAGAAAGLEGGRAALGHALVEAPHVALRLLLETLVAGAAPWDGEDAAQEEARRRMAPLLAWLRGHGEDLPLTRGEVVEGVLCEAHERPGVVALGGVGLLRAELEDWERVPELPLLLARAHTGRAGAAAQVQRLRELATKLDPDFVRTVGDTEPGLWPPSEALAAAYRHAHLGADEHAAWGASRARALWDLASRATHALAEVRWDEESIRELYLRVGDLADALAEEAPEELGRGEALSLIRQLPVVSGPGEGGAR